MKQIATKGLDSITDFPQGDLVLFRRFELAVAINRLRSLVIRNSYFSLGIFKIRIAAELGQSIFSGQLNLAS